MRRIHKKVMALLLAAVMVASVMDTHVQAESLEAVNNISVVDAEDTEDAEEVSDLEEKDKAENADEAEDKAESDGAEAVTEDTEEAGEESADNEEKKDADTNETKDEVVVQAAKNAPTEVKSCAVSGFMPEILNLEFSDEDWMDAITAVSVNGDTSYTKGTISSYGSSGKLWEVGNTMGSYGSYKALKITGFASDAYPLTVKVTASGYEDVTIKVVKTKVSYSGRLYCNH